MYPFIRSTAAAAVLATLAAAPAVADAPKLPMRSGEVATPSALAQGEQYLSISKALTCGINNCIATVKGRAKKQTVITGISCLTVADNSQILYGAATKPEDGEVALALFPVQSRTVSGTLEHALVGGPAQIVLGPDDSALFGVVATSAIEQAICVLTGTTTKL
jgi:hypothetical protein